MNGSITIMAMTMPKGCWIWSLLDADGKHMNLSNGGYQSAEAAADHVCHILKAMGSDTETVEIWIERKVRSRWKCKKHSTEVKI